MQSLISFTISMETIQFLAGKRVLYPRCFDVGYVENTVHMKTGSTSFVDVVSNAVVPTSGTTFTTRCIRKLDRRHLSTLC